ncbi:MAG: helix-turn-helix domain-containing protein [Pseudonocardia sediminis]
MANALPTAGGTGSDGVRLARTAWRRGQIVEAATRLLERHGFHGMSMQALAKEAGVSVGLIYSYIGGKEDVVVAVVLDVIDQLNSLTTTAMDAAGDDPVERLAAGFGAYARVLDTHRHAGLLTYRQSGELGPDARSRLKTSELTTLVPLREAAGAAETAGLLVRGADLDLLVFDMMILAHGWALKHWHFGDDVDVHRYVASQTAAMLRSVLAPERHAAYRHLLEPVPE